MLNVNESIAFIKPCYKMSRFASKIWRYAESTYLCNVFFIVLDLRLTKKIGCLGWIAFFYALYCPSIFHKYISSPDSFPSIS